MNRPKRGDVYWVNLDPTIGNEIRKKRPAMIVSNDSANSVASRVIVAPITSNASVILPFEVAISVNGKNGKILLDQIRSIDKLRLDKQIEYTCSDHTFLQIAEALRVALGLPLTQ